MPMKYDSLSIRRCGKLIGSACRCGDQRRMQRGSRQRSRAGRKGRIQTRGNRIDARRRLTRIPELVIDLDELNLRELSEARHERVRDVIQRSVRSAIPCEVHMHSTIQEFHFTVSCKTIRDHSKTPIPFHIAGTLEKLIQDRIYDIL